MAGAEVFKAFMKPAHPVFHFLISGMKDSVINFYGEK